jgi:hypothetical protein
MVVGCLRALAVEEAVGPGRDGAELPGEWRYRRLTTVAWEMDDGDARTNGLAHRGEGRRIRRLLRRKQAGRAVVGASERRRSKDRRVSVRGQQLSNSTMGGAGGGVGGWRQGRASGGSGTGGGRQWCGGGQRLPDSATGAAGDRAGG